MSLSLRNLALPLSDFVLQVDLTVGPETTCVFGPSGSGKSSLLELIAGLRRPTTGRISFGDDVLTDVSAGVQVPARSRGIGYVPQDLALFPHLSVRQNLLYGHHSFSGPIRFHLDAVVDLVELSSLLARRPGVLSGGESRRVALGRALLAQPRLLLLDEPFANLDSVTRSKIISYLIRIRSEFRIPMVLVTHDRLEAIALAETMIVLIHGAVQQLGPTREIFHRPSNRLVAEVVAIETIQPGHISEQCGDLVRVNVGTQTLFAMASLETFKAGEVTVCIRAEDVVLMRDEIGSGSPRNRLSCVVCSIAPQGPLMRVDLDCGFPLIALLTRSACEELAIVPGRSVTALIKAPNVHLIPR